MYLYRHEFHCQKEYINIYKRIPMVVFYLRSEGCIRATRKYIPLVYLGLDKHSVIGSLKV